MKEREQGKEGAMSNPSHKAWHDLIDWEHPVTEDDVWAAIAEANGLDYSEIADGDLVDWL